MSSLNDIDLRSELPQHLDAEITRLSQDTDTILDSIRRAAEPTPRNRPKFQSLEEMLEVQRRASTKLENDNIDHADTDDDMTEDGSLPDDVRQQLQDELSMVDNLFSVKRKSISEGSTKESAFFIPVSPILKKMKGKQEERQAKKTVQFFELHWLVMVLLVWCVLMVLFARIIQNGLVFIEGVID
jgi:hypothetical protein